MEIPTQNNQVVELEKRIEQSQRDHRIAIVKAVGGVVAPVAIAGGLAGLASNFENRDIGTLVALGVGFALGYSGIVREYVESMKDIYHDICDASSSVKHYRSNLTDLNHS